jgi:endonuclease-3
MKKKDIASITFQRLIQKWPDAHCELYHESPFQLLIATILSAQCTDERVNQVTPILFTAYPDPKSLANAIQEDVEAIIHSTGFYKNKAKNIIKCAKDIVEIHNGKIPQNIQELTSLAGVGRKTANVVLGNAFNINMGVVVDTHVKRISNRLKLTKSSDPIKIEQDLMKLFDQGCWTILSHLYIFLGRRVCFARKPQCDLCFLADICPSASLK